ncbi:MAG: GNAT family N-acetyltransferase [bacterium]
MISFRRVRSMKQVMTVVRLAREIWMEHYVPIVGQEQVEYMLKNFQSEHALKEQLSEGYEYYIVMREGVTAGYCAVVADERDTTVMLSKIYVRRSQRGHGVGKAIAKFVERLCFKRGITKIWLVVNRKNVDSIAWYLRAGFQNVGSTVRDIGGGFVMDDFRMEKTVLP